MKYILHIAASLRIGGAEKVARDIGLYANKTEYQNHYIVFGNEIGSYEQMLIEHGCKIFHIESPRKNYCQFFGNLKHIMSTYQYTVVHAHTMFNAGFVMYMAKKMNVPIRVVHAHSALETLGGIKVKIYEKLMRCMILLFATDLIACGEKAGIRLYGSKKYKESAKLILNGIDIEKFKFNEEKRKQIRQQLNLEENWIIGHVGHLAEVKNQKYLIELMPQILGKLPKAKLLLLGEGEDREMLEKTILDLGIQDDVLMTGNVLNVEDYLSAMDVFAFPSLYEGMPLSIIEVQANGLPCILSTGVPKDVYLSDLIYPLSLEKPEMWKEMICNCQRKYPEKYAEMLMQTGFDTKSVMKKIYDVYEKEN